MNLSALICHDCGAGLDDLERRYYGYRCERCERAHHDRVEAWRMGAPDIELDRLYNVSTRDQRKQ